MIHRAPWLKRYSTEVILSAVDGKMRLQLCLFELAAQGIIQKLHPTRCKDPEMAVKIDQKQEELSIILNNALKGYQKKQETPKRLDGATLNAIAKLSDQAWGGNKIAAITLEEVCGIPATEIARKAGRMAPALPFPEKDKNNN